MKSFRSIHSALLAVVAVAWSVPALAVFPGNCANGKTLFYKTSGGFEVSCSQAGCHKNMSQNVSTGANNPGQINQFLDTLPAMAGLRGSIPLSADGQDVDDIATFLGTYPAACPTGGGTPNLQASPSPLNFGSVTVGATSATTTVTITNAGTGSALAVSAASSDPTHFPVTSNTCLGITVGAGGSCSFKVAFHPTAAGALSSNVVVNRTGGTLNVGVSGTGGSASPGQLSISSASNFGNQTVGTTSAASTMTVTNIGGSSVSVSSVTSNNPSEFAVVSNTCGTVAVSGSCAIGVTFRPSTTGARVGTVTVVSTGTGSPQAVGFSGNGTSVATPGQLSMNATLGFGSQAVGTTSAISAVAIVNTGGASVTVSSVTSSNPSEFTIASNTCGVVAAGAGCAIGVTFKPGAAGARSGSISVVSNGTGSPQAISATGTGASTQGAATVTVVEYHHAPFDHYFITSDPDEIAILDARTVSFLLDWVRTGYTFKAYVNAGAPASSVGICRFFNDSAAFAPKSSHFYAPHGLGCEDTISAFPDWKLENDKLFNAMVPDAVGHCPTGTIPVYRLYNNGMGGAPNHRFTISLAVQQAMLASGYVAEPKGTGVGMCVPP